MMLYNYITICEREEVTWDWKKLHMGRKYIVCTLRLILLGLPSEERDEWGM
jgi:hypothetical protein